MSRVEIGECPGTSLKGGPRKVSPGNYSWLSDFFPRSGLRASQLQSLIDQIWVIKRPPPAVDSVSAPISWATCPPHLYPHPPLAKEGRGQWHLRPPAHRAHGSRAEEHICHPLQLRFLGNTEITRDQSSLTQPEKL